MLAHLRMGTKSLENLMIQLLKISQDLITWALSIAIIKHNYAEISKLTECAVLVISAALRTAKINWELLHKQCLQSIKKF